MNETIKEIVTEMREKTAKSKDEAWYDRERWAELCNRLEAAHKREVVNTAKLREVVDKWSRHLGFKFANGFGIDSAVDIGRDMLVCLGEIKQSISAPLDTKPAENVNSDAAIYNPAKMREALERIVEKTNDAELTDLCAREYAADISAEALTAPARNCDLYPTLAAALDAWREVDPREAGPFNEWLFAKAKGGAK